MSDVLTIKHTTLLPVQEDEEFYVLQDETMRVIYRLKRLQQHPRNINRKKKKITSTAYGIAAYWTLHGKNLFNKH